MSFIIRNLETYEEMLALHQLQHKIWGLEAGFGLYPPLLLSAVKNGGIVLGAFDDDTGQMVAFLFGFLGQEPGGPLKLCSQTMGVLPEYRGRGIAQALKQTQREHVIALGLPLVTWTFDPLEGPNAQLNLHKLRAISRTYWRDVYGGNFGALNAGLPSDRLIVEWWVKGRRLQAKSMPTYFELIESAVSIFEIANSGIELHIVEANFELEATPLLLEIPAHIHPLKAANLQLALDWRLKVRQAFETYFAKGYLATDFVSKFEQNERHNYYLLEKSSPELLTEIGITC